MNKFILLIFLTTKIEEKEIPSDVGLDPNNVGTNPSDVGWDPSDVRSDPVM